MTTETKPAPTEAEIEEAGRQAKVSFQFMQRHLDDFVPNKFNAALIQKYIWARNLMWDFSGLEQAHKFCEAGYDPTPDEQPAPPAPEAPPIREDLPEWHGKISREYVRDLSRADMQRFMRDKLHGREFVKRVNDLKLTRGQIRP
jgi:hypothetical protein